MIRPERGRVLWARVRARCFQSRVALEAIRGELMLVELARNMGSQMMIVQRKLRPIGGGSSDLLREDGAGAPVSSTTVEKLQA